MLKNKLIKFSAVVLLIAQVSFWPLSVLAQFGSLCGTLIPCSVYDTNNGSTAGVAGATANAAFATALASITAVNSGCITAEQTYESSDSAAQLGFSGLSIIGGDAVLLTQLSAKITVYNGFIKCRQGVLTSLTALLAPNVYTSNQKQTMTNQVNQAITNWRAKLEQAQARYNNAKQGFWKTLVFNILVKTSKAVANSLVQKLVGNYKVRNALQYTDSVATLMYDNQFIRQNFPSSEGQFMARAILENPMVRNKVPYTAFVAADSALGFNPKLLDTSDPDFYVKMASVGNTVANPYYQHTTNIGGVDQARAQSIAYAQTLVNQGNGLKAPVTCAGSLAQQKSIDMQYKTASDRFDDRYALLANLKQAKDLGKNVSDADIQKAQADFDAAREAMKILPQNVSSPATTICEAIVSPASLIDKGIDEAFKSVGTKLGQYDNNNLPSFMNLIGDVASQIGSSLIFGGLNGAKSAAIINEQRVANAVVQAGTDALYSNASENLAKGGVFSAEKDPNFDDAYDLSWDVVTATSNLEKASFVTIQGDGISAVKVDPTTKKNVVNKMSLSGSAIIHTSVGGGYTLTVFDANGRALTALSTTINIGTVQAYNNAAEPKVAGAYISRPTLNIRGEPLVVLPRGEQ